MKQNTKPNALANGFEMLVKDRFGSSYSKGDEKKFIERVDISWCLQLTAANESNRYVAGFSFSRNSIRSARIRMLLASDIVYWLLSNYRVITHSWPHVSNEIHREIPNDTDTIANRAHLFWISETAPEFKWYGFHFTNEHLCNIVVKTAQWIFTNNLLFFIMVFSVYCLFDYLFERRQQFEFEPFRLELEIIFGSNKDLRMVNTNNVKWCYFIDSEEIESQIEKIPNNNNCQMKQNKTNFIESDFSLDNVIQGKSIWNWKFWQINCYEVLSSDPTNYVEFGTNKNTKTMCRNKSRTSHCIAIRCSGEQCDSISTNSSIVDNRYKCWHSQWKIWISCSIQMFQPTDQPSIQPTNKITIETITSQSFDQELVTNKLSN